MWAACSSACSGASAVSQARLSRTSRRQPRLLRSPQASALPDLFEAGERKIELIVSDVDGTLLNSQQQLTPGVRAAAVAAAECGVPLVVATGKAQGPWVKDVLPHLGSRLPQIYLQGLLINCHDEGVLYSRQLEEDIILEAIEFAERHNLTLTAYCGDRIVCKRTNEQSDRLIWYKEPTPESIGPLEAQVGRLPIFKLIFMEEQPRIAQLRPQVEAMFAGRASLTTAIPGMLEVLPLGASKGLGVSWLLDKLGVDPAACLALGDGENDVEMLQLAGLGVAMGNAHAPARAAADAFTASNDEDGVARAIERYVLAPRGMAVPTTAGTAA